MTQTHECRQCTCCGKCCCYDWQNDHHRCRACREYAEWAILAESALETYLSAEKEGGWFIQSPKSEKVHVVGCPTYKSIIRYVTKYIDRGCHHELGMNPYPHDSDIPRVVRAEQLHHGVRCRLCVPDVSLPPDPGEARIWWRKSGTGWPDAPRKSLTEVLGPSRYRPVAP